MPLNPEARAMITEVAGSRADARVAEAVHQTAQAEYERGITEARQHLGEVYSPDDSGFIGTREIAEFARASLELEGTRTYDAIRAGRRIADFQSRPENPAIMLAIGSERSSDHDIVAAFADPNMPEPPFMNARAHTSFAGGIYDLTISGGTPDFPVVSARTGRYANRLSTGRFYAGNHGTVDTISFERLSVMGSFLGFQSLEMRQLEGTISNPSGPNGRLHDAILFDEHAVAYLSARLRGEMRADMGMHRLDKTGDISDDLPLVMIAKDIMGIDLSEYEADLTANELFRERVLEAVAGYAKELAGTDPEQAAERVGAPLYLHGRILDMVDLEAPEIEAAVEKGALEAGGVLEESDQEAIAERIEQGKKRQIRETVEPRLQAREETIRKGFDAAKPYTGLEITADQLVAAVFGDQDKFWQATAQDLLYGDGLRDALYNYSVRARSFREASEA